MYIDIQYNSLNLPSVLQFTNGNRTDYLYSADGMKRRVTHKTAIANISVPMGQIKELASNQISQTHTTDYCGNVIYENGTLSRILTEEGYVTLSGTTPTYHYYLKDHQGNNRVVINQSNTVEQVNHYYLFGGLFEVNTSTAGVQPYKYNGKELDRMHELDWYDYGARHYDAALGRFHTNDRFAEKYQSLSTYQYGANNPVKNIDVNGDSIWFTQYKDQNIERFVMHITGKVLNDSKNNINMSSAVNSITKAIKRTYQGNIDGSKFETDIQLSIAKSMDDVDENDHLFVLTNNIIQPQKGTIYGASNNIGGKVAFIDADYFTGFYDRMMGSRNYGSFTAVHELGHLLGLEHYEKNPFNVMRSNGMFYGIKSSQLKQIYTNWNNGYLNVGSNYMLMPLGNKRPNVGQQIYVKP